MILGQLDVICFYKVASFCEISSLMSDIYDLDKLWQNWLRFDKFEIFKLPVGLDLIYRTDTSTSASFKVSVEYLGFFAQNIAKIRVKNIVDKKS